MLQQTIHGLKARYELRIQDLRPLSSAVVLFLLSHYKCEQFGVVVQYQAQEKAYPQDAICKCAPVRCLLVFCNSLPIRCSCADHWRLALSVECMASSQLLELDRRIMKSALRQAKQAKENRAGVQS